MSTSTEADNSSEIVEQRARELRQEGVGYSDAATALAGEIYRSERCKETRLGDMGAPPYPSHRLAIWQLRYLLFHRNSVLRPAYRPLLCIDDQKANGELRQARRDQQQCTLPRATVAGFCRLVHPSLSDDDLAAEIASVTDQLERGDRSYRDSFVAESAPGEIIGATSLVHIQPGAIVITTPRCAADASQPVAAQEQLISEAHQRACELGATRIFLRVEHAGATNALARHIKTLGFEMRHLRPEFDTPVADLPNDDCTPLAWVPMGAPECASVADAADILERAAQGDPEWDPRDNASELLDSFLREADLYREPDCVQIAKLGDQIAGIVIAQTEGTTGWSRITYMGLVPELRGQGYGRWLHRHGFAMLKAQGALVYHGGTVQSNDAMIALFQRHGCRHQRTLAEWLYQVPAPPS